MLDLCSFHCFTKFCDTSHKAKIGAKSAKLNVDALMSDHYHVVTSLETVQPISMLHTGPSEQPVFSPSSCRQVTAEDIQIQK